MSDERLRRLERRWRETGEISDEAAYLLERSRTGDLTAERLALAAYAGHPAACAALGTDAPAALEWPQAWFDGLERWGAEALTCATLELAQLLLAPWRRDFPDDHRPEEAIGAAAAWLAAPSEDGAARAELAAELAMGATVEALAAPENPLSACSYAAYVAATIAGGAVGTAATPLEAWRAAVDVGSPDDLERTLRCGLARWALSALPPVEEEEPDLL